MAQWCDDAMLNRLLEEKSREKKGTDVRRLLFDQKQTQVIIHFGAAAAGTAGTRGQSKRIYINKTIWSKFVRVRLAKLPDRFT